MVVFKRFGPLVLLSIPISFMIIFGLTNMIYGKGTGPAYDKHVNTMLMYLFWLPAFFNFILEKIFCRNEKEETLYNNQGQPIKVNNYSTLFYIRNKYWTYILLVGFAIVAFSMNFKK